MTKEYCSIVFMHDYEDESGLIPRFFDNEITESEMIDYLAQWDCGAESEYLKVPTDETPWGLKDNTFPHEDYILAWNTGLAYVSLTRIIETPDEPLTTIKPPQLTLTPWEAEQLSYLMQHCKDIGSIMGMNDSREPDSTDIKLADLMARMDEYVEGSRS